MKIAAEGGTPQLGIPPRAISAPNAHSEAMKKLVEVAIGPGGRLAESVAPRPPSTGTPSGGAMDLIARKERLSERQDPAPDREDTPSRRLADADGLV